MNSKKALELITLAGACASFSAFANTTNAWFVADAAANPALVNVTTNRPVSVVDNKFVIDNDSNSPLVFTPGVPLASTNSTNIARIDVIARLTASRTNDFASVSGAKVGFAVGINESNATNYYGYLNDAWKNLGGVPNLEADTAFSIILNYRDGQASFFANGVDLGTEDFTPGGTLNHLDAYGEGSIASIISSYEVAVAAYGDDNKKYGSIAEATQAAIKDEATAAEVQGISPSGEVLEKNATAANGMSYVVCEALGIDVTDPAANIAVAPVATDTATDKITLQLTTPTTGTEANLVGYKVTPADPEVVYEAGSIQIPLAAGTYTITPVLK